MGGGGLKNGQNNMMPPGITGLHRRNDNVAWTNQSNLGTQTCTSLEKETTYGGPIHSNYK